MKKHGHAAKAPMKSRTGINDISPVGSQLSEQDLRLVVGGCYVSTAPLGIIG